MANRKFKSYPLVVTASIFLCLSLCPLGALYLRFESNPSSRTNLSQAIIVRDPFWSPNGEYLLTTCSFGGWEFPDYEICVSKPDGTELMRLNEEDAGYLSNSQPAWAPDSSSLVFNSKSKLILASVPSGKKRGILNAPCNYSQWSSDSLQILCAVNYYSKEVGGIILIDINQNTSQKLATTLSPNQVVFLRWSDVNKQLIYFMRERSYLPSYRSETNITRMWEYDLYEFNLITQKETPVMANLASTNVFWSKDEKTLYFLKGASRGDRENNSYALYELDISSKVEKRIRDDLPKTIFLSPDRKHLVYLDGNGRKELALISIDIETGASKDLFENYRKEICAFHIFIPHALSHNEKYLALAKNNYASGGKYKFWILEITSGKFFPLSSTERIDDLVGLSWSSNDTYIAITHRPQNDYKLSILPVSINNATSAPCKESSQ